MLMSGDVVPFIEAHNYFKTDAAVVQIKGWAGSTKHSEDTNPDGNSAAEPKAHSQPSIWIQCPLPTTAIF